MKSALTDKQFRQEVVRYTRSAFRLELQPFYDVGSERELFEAFIAGTPVPPTTREGFRAYYQEISADTAKGIMVSRVRIVDDPPTPYQRWTRYMDRWNIEAGEIIHYLDRAKAEVEELTKAFDGRDWWLLDDKRLLLMTFTEGRRADTNLTTAPKTVRQARIWRDVAVRLARGENTE